MIIVSNIIRMIRCKARKESFGLFGTLALAADFFSASRNRNNFSLNQSKYDCIIKKAVDEIKVKGFYAIEGFYTKEKSSLLASRLRELLQCNPELIHPATKADKRIHGVEKLDDLFLNYSNDVLIHEIARVYSQKPVDVAFTLGARLITNPANLGSGGGWHRDSTVRQFKSMIYLSDVGIEEGPFQIIESSHRFLHSVRNNKIMNIRYGDVRFKPLDVSNLLDVIGHEKLHTITAKAGTLLIFDSSAIHRGCPITKGERLALTNYFFPVEEINSELYSHFKPVVGRS